MASAAKVAAAKSKTRNTTRAFSPTLPIAPASADDPTPVISSDTTRGMTVIWRALTHTAPMGSTKGIMARREVSCDDEIAMPVISPAVSPMAARSVKDMHQTVSYNIAV